MLVFSKEFGTIQRNLQLTDSAFLGHSLPISLPPLDEQVAIAQFLDYDGGKGKAVG